MKWIMPPVPLPANDPTPSGESYIYIEKIHEHQTLLILREKQFSELLDALA